MNDEEIKKLIQSENLKIQLDASEKRLNYAMLLFGLIIAIIGGVVPLLTYLNNKDYGDDFSQMEARNNKIIDDLKNDVNNLSARNEKLLEQITIKIDDKLLRSEDKLDVKLKDFNNKFDEITNKAYQKPKLVCLYKGQDLSGRMINYIWSGENYIDITIRNIGNAVASINMIYLYIDKDSIYTNIDDTNKKSNDPRYKSMFTDEYKMSIDAKNEVMFNFQVFNEKNTELFCLLKIYYGQPEPLEYQFTININKASGMNRAF